MLTRYIYKPDAGEGDSHFNDNRRLHIFVVDVASKRVRQLTDGTAYEHSIDWSPKGDEIVYISDPSPNADQFFNYDIFAIKVSDGTVRRITATENAEYSPKWSPDGKMIAYSATKRGLTDRETTMEDTHVWVVNADGSNRHEVATIDNRQGPPQWSADSSAVYYTVQERGNVRLYRQALTDFTPEVIVRERGSVGSFSVAKSGDVFCAFASPMDMGELYESVVMPLSTTVAIPNQTKPARRPELFKQLTDFNSELLKGKSIADVESFTFTSNDNKFQVEAFLVKPLGMTVTSKHPLIVNIHGGPHGQNGPAFKFKDQVYAAHGWAVLHVNYRGSKGYGQAFADAVFGDQDGNEGQDVLYGVSAALRRIFVAGPRTNGN